MRQLRVELTRFRSRRAIALLVLLAALVAAVVAGKAIYDSRPATGAEVATARAQAQVDAQQPGVRQELDSCLADPDQYFGSDASAGRCRGELLPAATQYLDRTPLRLTGVMNGDGIGIAVLVAGFMVLAGCTFAGADWSTGSMTNQVLFRPRRFGLWWAKALAVALGTALAALVVVGGFWAALGITQAVRGSAPSSAVQIDIGWQVLRAVGLSAAAGVGGYALTMLFRHTTATVALLFAYGVGGEILLNLLPVDGVTRWSLGNNVGSWMQQGFRYFDPTARCTSGVDCGSLVQLGYLRSGGFLVVLLAAAAVLSLLAFRRRDA